MVSTADRLAKESEGISKALSRLTVSESGVLLLIGGAFRAEERESRRDYFSRYLWFSAVQSECYSFTLLLFFLPWLALFDAFTNTHSI